MAFVNFQSQNSHQIGLKQRTFKALQKPFRKLNLSTNQFRYIKRTCVSVKAISPRRVKFHKISIHTCIRMLDDVAFYPMTGRSTRRRVQLHSITLLSNCGCWAIPFFYQYRCLVPPHICTVSPVELMEFHGCNAEFQCPNQGFGNS